VDLVVKELNSADELEELEGYSLSSVKYKQETRCRSGGEDLFLFILKSFKKIFFNKKLK